ncbi:hypothetical protein [uncultured Pseudokineococcus sp.]|uniref:hypothetical protein n=1 Tax=uncultured Pseudokineococcus sp. TaxID=1642928 RepID=UPI00260724FF|nr:hypothetical protein [uncultured Pseudokineococcus sp.]
MPEPTRASRSPRHRSRLGALLRREPAPDAGAPAVEVPPAPPADEQPAAPPPEEPALPPVPRTPLADVLRGWGEELARAGGRGVLVDDRTASSELVPPLDVGGAHPSGLAAFWAGRPTRLSSLFRERGAHEVARERVRLLRTASTEVTAQHGTPTCALAVGLVRWSGPAVEGPPGSDPVADGPVEVHAPALLQRLDLRPRGAGALDEELDLRPEVRVNPALVHLLARRGHEVDVAEVLAPFADGHGDAHRRALRELAAQLAGVPGLQLGERTLVGVYPELAGPLTADVEALLAAAAAPSGSGAEESLGGLVSGLAEVAAGGPVEPSVAEGPGSPEPGWGDVATWRVLDLDEDQRAVHDAVASGRSLRVLAEPGTGATQLVAQVVASAAGAGRRCLVLAPSLGEAADVTARLHEAGLGALVDPADRSAPRATGADPAAAAPDEAASPADGPEEAVARLRAGARALDVPAGEGLDTGVLATTQALVRLARLPHPPRSPVRLDAAAVSAASAEGLPRVVAGVRRAARLGAFRPELAASPWQGAALGSADEAHVARRRAEELAEVRLPRLADHLAALGERTGLRPPRTVDEVGRRLGLLVDVRGTLEEFTPGVYERPLGELVRALGQDASWRTRRTAQKVVAEVVRPGARPGDLRTSLRRADAERRAWSAAALDGGRPRVPSGIAEVQRALADVVAELDRLEPVLRGTRAGAGLRGADLAALEVRLRDLAEDPDARGDLPRRVDVLVHLASLGLGELVADLRERGLAGAPVDEEGAGREAELVVRASALAEARRRGVLDDLLPGRAAAARAQLVAGVAAQRRRAAADLVAAQPEPLVRCASLLALPSRLGALGEGARADLVVVLDASAAGVPEAALALARGAQVLVLGDPAGPPPSSAVVGAPAPEHPGTAAPASLWASTAGLLDERALRGLHRLPRQLVPVLAAARAEALDPSDGSGQPASPTAPEGSTDPAGGSLRAVPAPPGSWPVVLRRSGGRGRASEDGVVHSLDVEVEAVVETALGHLREDPQRSLAVVAVTRGHARRVADALRAAVAADPELAAVLARTPRAGEPLVVTDVGRAQGVVRDVVVLATAFAPTERGRVPSSFGPLDAAGGAAALADAAAGARRRLVVVTSLEAEGLDPDRLRTPGARALRSLLVAAEAADARGPSEGGPVTGDVDASPPDVAPEDLLPPGDDAARALGAHALASALVAQPPAEAAEDGASGDGASGDGATRDEVVEDGVVEPADDDPLVDALVQRLRAAGAQVRRGSEPGDPDLSVRLADGRSVAVLPDVRPPGPEVGTSAADPVLRAQEAAALRRQGWAVAHVPSLGLLVDPAGEAARVIAAARRPWSPVEQPAPTTEDGA